MRSNLKISSDDRSRLQVLEGGLWQSDLRFDRAWMGKILAIDFVEFGRSGRVYQRKEIVDDMTPRPIDARLPLIDFRARLLDLNVALITYVSVVNCGNEVQLANRTSIWSRGDDGWRLRFHQGTAIQQGTQIG